MFFIAKCIIFAANNFICMQVYQGKILNITLENEEIEILRTILNQLTGKKIGFVKTLDLEQLDLLERLKEAINHPDNNK